jgi:hypothetical protein
MGQPTVYTEALRRAASAIGGEARLAQAFSTPEEQIHRWVSGAERPPTDIYHKALDLLISTGAN